MFLSWETTEDWSAQRTFDQVWWVWIRLYSSGGSMTESLGNYMLHGIVGYELLEPIYPKQGCCCCWSSILLKVFYQWEHFCCIPTGLYSGHPGGWLKGKIVLLRHHLAPGIFSESLWQQSMDKTSLSSVWSPLLHHFPPCPLLPLQDRLKGNRPIFHQPCWSRAANWSCAVADNQNHSSFQETYIDNDQNPAHDKELQGEVCVTPATHLCLYNVSWTAVQLSQVKDMA